MICKQSCTDYFNFAVFEHDIMDSGFTNVLKLDTRKYLLSTYRRCIEYMSSDLY